MASNKTPNLGMDVWAETDYFKRAELNNNFNKLDNKVKEHGDKIDAVSKKEIYHRETYGTFETGAVLSAIANDEGNPRPQVVGFSSTDKASTYSDRDSVALYVSNRSKKPTVVVNSGTATYTAVTVQVTGVTITNLDKVKPGMLIDTYHTPNRWTSIVASVNVGTQTITIKDGWYEVKTGGSATPSIPPNGTGFDISRTTKVWGINNNVFLYDGDGAYSGAVAEEIGLFKYGTDPGGIGGIDLVNFVNKAGFGFRIRKSSGATEGFAEGYSASDSDAGFVFRTTDASKYPLLSYLNGEATNTGFNIGANGLLSKLKLLSSVFGNGQLSYNTVSERVFILNKSVQETFDLPAPTGRSGEFLFIMNVGSAAVTLQNKGGTGNFVKNSSTPTLSLPAKSQLILISDNTNWYAMGANFGMLIKGNTTIDNDGSTGLELGSQSVAGLSYIDFHSSGSPNDYDARLQVNNGVSGTVGKGDANLLSGTFKFNSNNVVTSKAGNGAPTTAPDFTGQLYLDVTNKKTYHAYGYASVSDWGLLN